MNPPPSFLRRALVHRSFVVGGAISLLLLLAALLSLVWTPWPPYAMDLQAKLLPPSAAHWLGTDVYGRDVASLLLLGARSAIVVGVVAVGIGLFIGTALGLLAAAQRGWVEEVTMRISDFTLAFPAILWAITWGHVLPNIAPALIVQVSIRFAVAILAEAALSYLGLGTQPPQASWGRLLSEAQTLLYQAPMLAVYPGCAIALAVLGLNLLGDGLRDLLDPRLR